MKTERICGFFVHMLPDEENLVLEFLEAAGYEKNSTGLHDYIFDCIEDDSTQDSASREKQRKNEVYEKVKQFMEENPEAVQLYGSLAKNFISNIIKKGRS